MIHRPGARQRVAHATCLAIGLASAGMASPAAAAPPAWSELPHMQLDGQFAGPLQDTVIQRWADPAAGTLCYVYLPITATHSPPTPSGYVDYGGNTIGSISCLAAPAAQLRAPAHHPAAPAH